MAGIVRAPIAGNLAAQPHQAIGVLHRPLQREGELGDGVLDEVRLDL